MQSSGARCSVTRESLEVPLKAAVVEQFGEPMVVHSDWAEPDCGPRDAVIRVEACGICRSDHTIWKGGVPWMGIIPELPLVMGHEYCGVVEEVGSDVTRFAVGDRVVAPFNHGCGSCEYCSAGHQNVCSDPGRAAEFRVVRQISTGSEEAWLRQA